MLLQIEILVFFVSLGYIIYYSYDVFANLYSQRKEKMLQREQKRKERTEKLKHASQKKDSPEIQESSPHITPEQSEQIREIYKRAELNLSRGYIETAQSRIVEGLAIKKDDKMLNMLLAQSYEAEKKYENAKYIYKDLLESHENDEQIFKKLADVYVHLNQPEKAIVNYEKSLEKDRGNIEILEIMWDLNLEIKNYPETLKYTNLYLKEKPRSVKFLWLKWYALEKLWNIDEALIMYKKVIELQPYNDDILERIKKLEK